MCLVEFVGPRGSRLDISCTVPVTGRDGGAHEYGGRCSRRAKAVLAFLLINHPLDCPICDKGGECPLQDQTMQYGPGSSQFVEPKRQRKHYPVSDLIMLDQERCVLCWRCIRYLEEWEDKPQLGLFQPRRSTVIDIFPGQPVDAKTSGSIIDICPVGALTDRIGPLPLPALGAQDARPASARTARWAATCGWTSACTSCGASWRARTWRVNDNWICDKGRFLHQFADHPERLTDAAGARPGRRPARGHLGGGAGPGRRPPGRDRRRRTARRPWAAWPRRA